MGATAAVLMAVNTGLQYVSGQRQGAAAKAQGQYAQAVDEQNAQLADAQATDATQRGEIAVSRDRYANRQAAASTRTALAGQGIDIGSGSPVDVQASQAGLGALDEMTIRNNAAREAWGYNVEAIQQRKAGQMAAYTGQQEANAYRQQGYSTLISGGLNTYGLYQQSANQKADLRKGEYKPGGK